MTMARGFAAAVLTTLVLLTGCSQVRPLLRSQEPLEENPELVAVVPFERAAASERHIMADAERIVTAQVYGIIAEGSHFRAVADLAVQDAAAATQPYEDATRRARAIGKKVGAHAVFFGHVDRFIERVGNDYGADKPASVSFEIGLLSVESGKVLWTGRFDQTQQDLSSNLFNLWQFWRAGPRWFTAAELSQLGVEKLLEDLQDRTP